MGMGMGMDRYGAGGEQGYTHQLVHIPRTVAQVRRLRCADVQSQTLRRAAQCQNRLLVVSRFISKQVK